MILCQYPWGTFRVSREDGFVQGIQLDLELHFPFIINFPDSPGGLRKNVLSIKKNVSQSINSQPWAARTLRFERNWIWNLAKRNRAKTIWKQMFPAPSESRAGNEWFPNGNETIFHEITWFPFRLYCKTKRFRDVFATFKKYMKTNSFRAFPVCANTHFQNKYSESKESFWIEKYCFHSKMFSFNHFNQIQRKCKKQ